jgi:hypothetical protein
MAIVSGFVLGSPGPVGSAPVCVLYGAGSPTSQTIDPAAPNVRNCALASIYLDYFNGAWYLKTGVANAANPNGQWTQK